MDRGTYLRRAVVNRAQDTHRRSFRRAAPVGRGQDVGEPDVDGIWRFVECLPNPQRAVVVLRFYEDLSLVQIAAGGWTAPRARSVPISGGR